MNRHKITGSPQAVPFSWEHLPGISKITVQMDENPEPVSVHRTTKLRPPRDCSPHVDQKSMSHRLYIPLPPCRFLPNQTQNRKGVTRPEEDPFLAAFIECTKSVEEKERTMKAEKKAIRTNSWSRIERLRLGSVFSCKNSCAVRDGNLIKLPKLPEREVDFDW
jgi:hypothetical protein